MCCGGRWMQTSTARSWWKRRETVWDNLISGGERQELLRLSTLDIDDQICLGQYLPATLMGQLLRLHGADGRGQGAGGDPATTSTRSAP